MSDNNTVSLEIGMALPHGNARESASILAWWKHVAEFCRDREFKATPHAGLPVQTSRITLDASHLIALMENATADGGTFNEYRQKHIADVSLPINATLTFSLTSVTTGSRETHEIVNAFIQQVVLLSALTLPGAVQILQARFSGDAGFRYEARQFDSRVLYGCTQSLQGNGSLALASLSIATVWQWLEKAEVSQTNTAILPLNKVLFSLLKVAELRQDYSARTALVVLYQLESLMHCRNMPDHRLLRQRVTRVLGNIPEALDCLTNLWIIRESMYRGEQPVSRPMLLRHDLQGERHELLGPHDNVIELGTALVLALLQKLAENDSTGFGFEETFSYR
jgi:hypothetical protein